MDLLLEGLTEAIGAFMEEREKNLKSKVKVSGPLRLALEEALKAYQTCLLQTISDYVTSDKVYHRASSEFKLPGFSKAAYAANQPIGERFSEPFSLQEIAEAILNKKFLEEKIKLT